MVVVPINVVAPPGREWDRLAACTKDGKRQDEESDQTGSIPSTGHQVRVVSEDPGLVVSEVELDKESRDELGEQDAGLRLVVRDVSGVLDELGEVEIGSVETSDFGYELSSS